MDRRSRALLGMILLLAVMTASALSPVCPGHTGGHYDIRIGAWSEWELYAGPITLTADLVGGGCRQTVVGRTLQVGPFCVEHWFRSAF